MELLPFVDILKVFNNPINEEQAWAVCYQCAHFLFRNPTQEFYQIVYDSGIHSIWLNRHGDVLLRKGPPDPNGSGKGPPHHHHSHAHSSSETILYKKKGRVMATETDAVQALGTAIFEALDYGIEASEERQLSPGLESLIITMTNADSSMEDTSDLDPAHGHVADDEGIEKDADVDTRCTVADILRLCRGHLSSKQDASHHYKAVCRALTTEAGELFTFLDKISSGREKLSETADEDTRRLEELQRADWACLWVQVMRSLRQGVLLKKIEHVHQPPLEYELTPFEMILEDIRSRRYTLHKTRVNGEMPHKVKNDAHAVILDFIRSRPPLKAVNERKLKPKPPSPPDPRELLLNDIRARPKLKPIKDGKVVVESPKPSVEPEKPTTPVKRVIKPDFNLLLNNSFEESSEDEEQSDLSHQGSPSSPGNSMAMSPTQSWHRTVTRDALLHETSNNRPSRLQRRHTIMICESPLEGKVPLQELPPLEEEEDEPSPVRESHHLLVTPRYSLSDNDLPAQVVLRHQQVQALTGGRRSSLEHRRSLSSLTSGLSAIPEQEDQNNAATSPGDLAQGQRSASDPAPRPWSHEQAPPPNPSPPCKGRARFSHSMSMPGMKSTGGQYQPKISNTRQLTQPAGRRTGLPSTNNTSAPLSATSSNPQSSNGRMSSSSSEQSGSSGKATYMSSVYLSISKPTPQTNPPPSSLSMSSSLSSSSSSSSTPAPHANLDYSVSSQSPAFRRKNYSSSTGVVNTSPTKDLNQVPRWRQTQAREERLSRMRQQKLSNSQSLPDSPEDEFSNSLPESEAEVEMRSRRLSLDSSAAIYKDDDKISGSRINRLSGSAVFEESKSIPSRRLSLNQRKMGVREPGRRMKTPEEEEKVTRWRTLQEEELAERVAGHSSRSGGQISPVSGQRAQDHGVKATSNDQQEQTSSPVSKSLQSQHKWLNKDISPVREETDVLQQKRSGEEARFTRWRQLEESAGLVSHSPELMEGLDPDDYVSHADRVLPAAQPSLPVGCEPVPQQSSAWENFSASGMLPLPKRWQNPVECLSLTLEEVTHIRSVLTKAELESLISHPDLYQQVSKNKLCFTCKTTRFTLFGEWGTKCKFCKRTVCTKCLRKMNVPTDQFKNIPVYTLSPTPLSPEMHEFIQNLIKNTPAGSVPATRDGSPSRTQPQQLQQQQQPSSDNGNSKSIFNRSKPLQRSQSAVVSGPKQAAKALLRGPLMAICCDCKGMVMEILRTARTSLAMLTGSTSTVGSGPGSGLGASTQSLNH